MTTMAIEIARSPSKEGKRPEWISVFITNSQSRRHFAGPPKSTGYRISRCIHAERVVARESPLHEKPPVHVPACGRSLQAQWRRPARSTSRRPHPELPRICPLYSSPRPEHRKIAPPEIPARNPRPTAAPAHREYKERRDRKRGRFPEAPLPQRIPASVCVE